ncbi:MAG: hypothetical protein AAF533_18680 [Acidobacteriota bacterium]
MNLAEINLGDLESRCFKPTLAPKAVDWFRAHETDRPVVSRTLRDHRPHGQTVSDRDEIHLRDAMDELLGWYSVVEIGCLIGFFPNPLPEPLATDARTLLSHDDVRPFYERHYPLVLPQHLLRRLEGQGLGEPHPRAAALFIELLEATRVLDEDRDVLSWLRCLDDYRVSKGGVVVSSLDHVLETLESPQLFLEVSADTSSREPLARAVRGFGKFLAFAQDFHRLLERMSDEPLLQSAAWHLNGYWFERLRVRSPEVIDDAVGRLGGWNAHLEGDDADFEPTRRALGEVQDVLRDLASDHYAAALRQGL